MVKKGESVAHAELVGGAQTTQHSHPGGGGGGLVDKAGVVTTDSNAEAVVTFNTAYANTNYFILLTAVYPGDGCYGMVKPGTKTVSGFTIMSFDDGGREEANVEVYWATGPYSNP